MLENVQELNGCLWMGGENCPGNSSQVGEGELYLVGRYL